ncbi:MAG: hypothetical protein ACE5H4_09410 [Candidatus Thorarchaeota archaeon]
MSRTDPLRPMLRLALSTARSQHKLFVSLTDTSKMPEVKSLLAYLVESESWMIERLQHMMITGIVDELEELSRLEDRDSVPDPSPFDLSREETDPRIFVCNKVLKESVDTYTIYLRLATKAKSELVSGLFEYLAYMKRQQIHELRRACEQY